MPRCFQERGPNVMSFRKSLSIDVRSVSRSPWHVTVNRLVSRSRMTEVNLWPGARSRTDHRGSPRFTVIRHGTLDDTAPEALDPVDTRCVNCTPLRYGDCCARVTHAARLTTKRRKYDSHLSYTRSGGSLQRHACRVPR